MTDHKYVFQGPVGQMQLSHCTVYVQGIVEKLTLEDCEVQVSGIVNHRYDMQKRVVVDEPPKPANDYEVRELRREINELRWKLRNSQTHEEQLRNKINQLKESGAKEPEPSDDVLVQRICSLRDTLDREREAHAKEIDDMKYRLDVACEVNAKLRQHNEEVDRRSQEIADKHIDILATLMCLYPYTPDKDLAFEFGLPADRIRYAAAALGAIKSHEARAEAREYLRKQQIELVERRGGDQGHYNPRTRQIEKVDRKGKVLATYKSIVDAANRTGCSSTTVKKYCQSKKTIYMKDGITFRYKENENQNS